MEPINGMRGTLALSWGPWGGIYVCRGRLCLGWLAITYVPVEIDELMEAYSDPRSSGGRVMGERIEGRDTDA